MLNTWILVAYFLLEFPNEILCFNDQASRLSAYEVIIPKRLEREKRHTHQHYGSQQEKWEDNLSYSIHAEGYQYTLQLKKNKDLLAKDFVLYTYTKHGKLETSQPKLQEHCYYHGFVEGAETSVVVLSLCNGLRGRGSYGGAIGMAFVGTVCSDSLGGSISTVRKNHYFKNKYSGNEPVKEKCLVSHHEEAKVKATMETAPEKMKYASLGAQELCLELQEYNLGVYVTGYKLNNNDVSAHSTIVAHELGHNLGMNHDNNRPCSCSNPCIMNAAATRKTLNNQKHMSKQLTELKNTSAAFGDIDDKKETGCVTLLRNRVFQDYVHEEVKVKTMKKATKIPMACAITGAEGPRRCHRL
nr:PREDICTED: zinc metalloproteinase/disintegrin-like [Latimeria chalumnae]|eukprot:XP_006001808.1 PREDICTED: zinc metalloproteinase/disintegrin-like [Latimeria chalumnae]